MEKRSKRKANGLGKAPGKGASVAQLKRLELSEAVERVERLGTT
jgi:hypothetical protein